MELSKYRLGELIEQCDERNTKNDYLADDVRGISTEKSFIATKANLNGVSLTSYKVVKHGEFAYVADTSRRGDKIALAFNSTKNEILISSIYTVFRVTRVDLLDADYLFMYFNRPEFDRYSRFNSWGSARETFDWSEMCDIEIDLPPLDIQQKYVDVYNAMLANQQSYERGLEDLKLTCDAYIEELRRNTPSVAIGKYLMPSDERNTLNLSADSVRGLKEKFHLLSNDEKISVNAKENLISWYKENIPIPFDENTDDNKELTHLYDSNMAGYKEVFLQCMDSYREASMVELGNLDNAYGNLDFIIANKCIRQKAYEQIYDKLRKIVYQFRNEVYHFNLLKDGNGNFPVCILKVSELNQKYFLSKEKNLQGYTNVSIFQNVFDDIDASLEKFRCKIYRIEYVEPKAIPVSGKTFFNNNEK